MGMNSNMIYLNLLLVFSSTKSRYSQRLCLDLDLGLVTSCHVQLWPLKYQQRRFIIEVAHVRVISCICVTWVPSLPPPYWRLGAASLKSDGRNECEPRLWPIFWSIVFPQTRYFLNILTLKMVLFRQANRDKVSFVWALSLSQQHI